MSSTAGQGRTDGGIHRRVEHIMGMPISLALRGRHTATAASSTTMGAISAGAERAAAARSVEADDTVGHWLRRLFALSIRTRR